MKEIQKHIYFTIFLVILLVPSLGLILKLDFNENCENRALAEKPKFEISDQYFKEFEVYFKESIGFRNTLSHLNSSLKFNFLNSSVKPTEVLIGKNGFLIYTSKKDEEMASYIGSNSWTPSELESQYQMHFQRKQFLDSMKADYLIVVCPNKNQIYPEYLPWQMKMQTIKNDSRAQQLNDLFKRKNSTISYLYLKDALLSKKGKDLMYFKHDTHWNKLGAFYAYQKIMDELGIKPFEISDFLVTKKSKSTADLKNLLGICNDYNLTESVPDFVFSNSSMKATEVKCNHNSAIQLKNENAKDKRTILVFQDSFGTALTHFISLHFKNTIFVPSDYNENDIKQLKPDIVIAEKVERHL